jgi:hypothetical protein
MPVRDDWASANELIRRLDRVIDPQLCSLSILMVDDGSTRALPGLEFETRLSAVSQICKLRLRRTLGHQRAIGMGLVHVDKFFVCDAVVVMDADGEDTPEGTLQLIQAFSENRTCAIFAERSRRTESLSFRLFYHVYKVVHKILTGISVRVGNFSILPAGYLGTLVVMSELWNHYAASVFRSGMPFTTIPIARGYRITGASKMNFVSLAAHGISAISVFGDVVGVRLLVGSMAGALLAVLGVSLMLARSVARAQPIQARDLYLIGTLAIVLVQFITMSIGFTFTVLSNRINLGFVPLRDYELFVADAVFLYPND